MDTLYVEHFSIVRYTQVGVLNSNMLYLCYRKRTIDFGTYCIWVLFLSMKDNLKNVSA